MILVHSPKGGVGVTTVAANVALVLARQGIEVTVVDLTGQGTLSICLGGSANAAETPGSKEGRTIVFEGVRVLSIDRRRPANQILTEVMQHEGVGRLLIVDLASGDRTMFDLLLPLAAQRLCVLAPEPAALAVLPQAFAEVPGRRSDPPLFILNRVDDRSRLARDISHQFKGLLRERLIGIVRRDEAVNEAVAMMEPLGHYAPASAALADFKSIADFVSARFTLHATRGVA
jgi:cellulose biosynthesis protein BcsQ